MKSFNYLSAGILVAFIGFSMSACQPKNEAETTSAPQDSMVATADTSTLIQNPLENMPLDTAVWGVDVSGQHADINWELAKAAGVDFMYAHCTKGTRNDDPSFGKKWTEAGKAGIARGAIHYFQFGADTQQQLNAFAAAFTQDPKGLRPAIQIDGGSIPNNVRLNPEAAQKDLLAFLSAAEQKFGCKPILFTTRSSANNYMKDKKFGQFPLWISSLLPTPQLPDAWAGGEWTMWMKTEMGSLDGFQQPVQRSRFHATSVEFAKEMACSNP